MTGHTRRPYGSGSLITKGDRYYGQWSVSGKLIKRSLGPVRSVKHPNGLTKKQAEAELREQIALVKEVPIQGRVTFEEAAGRHLTKLQLNGRKKSTLDDYRGFLRVHLNPEFGDRDVKTISKRDIERFKDQKLRDGLTAKSVCNYLSLLHGVLEFCVKEEVLLRNPAKLVDKPKPREKDPSLKFLNQAELRKLIDAVPDDHLGPMERVLYLTCAMTGLRQGEAIALQWRDIDWKALKVRVNRNYVHGQFTSPKSGRARAVPMAEQVARALAKYETESPFSKDTDLVFCNPSTGKPYDRSKLYKRFKAAVRKAEVTDISFHGLRHTFGTRIAMAGIPLRQLQEWGGWEDYKTVLVYAHFAPGEQDAELVNRAFQEGSDEDQSEGIEEGIDLIERA